MKDGRSLPRDPFDPDAPPLSADIPMILGNTRGETRTLIGRGDPSLFALTWETLLAEARGELAVHGHARSRRGDRAVPRAGIRTYSPADVFFAATTDSRSWRGQVIEADRRAAQPAAAAHDLGVPVRLARRRSTAASGARITASTCRSCSTTRRSCRDKVGTGAERCALSAAHERRVARLRANRPSERRRAAARGRVYDLTRRATMVFDRDDARRGRSARRRAPAVRTGAVCSAGHVALALALSSLAVARCRALVGADAGAGPIARSILDTMKRATTLHGREGQHQRRLRLDLPAGPVAPLGRDGSARRR